MLQKQTNKQTNKQTKQKNIYMNVIQFTQKFLIIHTKY